MLSTDDCGGDCTPSYLRQRSLTSASPSTIAFSLLPFILTWIVTFLIARKRLFPILSNENQSQNGPDGEEGLPTFHKDGSSKTTTTSRSREHIRTMSGKRLAALVFSTSIGLSTVLVELLLCEISNTLNPAARGLAMHLTLVALLALSILITPAIEINAIVMALLGPSADATATRKRRPRIRFASGVALFVAWLLVFWYIPQTSFLRQKLQKNASTRTLDSSRPFTEACLERIGIIGISLMASLSGFAAVSSLWQTFGVRHRLVNDSDIARKATGLSATEEMLLTKQSRLRALQRRQSESASSAEPTGFVGRMVGSFRAGSSEMQEIKALQMEVSGLETMRYTLSSSLANLHSRRTEQERSRTTMGRFLAFGNSIFALYCAYRVCATSLSSLHRWWQPEHSFAASDPINNVLALLTTHWDGDLDQAAWSRQISFLLSGVMLLASVNAVLQTFRLFARFAPGLLQHAQTSFPLIISQVSGAYVVSSALLLRSNLPEEFSGAISEALGAPLDARFVENWFESWFLVTVALTATGILIGRKVGSNDDWDDTDDGWETGKRS